MKRLCSAAVAALALIGAAGAQEVGAAEEAWTAVMDDGVAAAQGGDLEGAVAALERAVVATEDPERKAESLRIFAIVRFQQGREADALALVDQALEQLAPLVGANDYDAVSSSADLWLLRADMFAALGRDDEHRSARIEAMRYADRLPQPSWRIEADGDAVHVLSGFRCPATIEGLPRAETSTYSATDVGCSYDFDADFPGLVTVYFTMQEGGGVETSVDAMRQEIDQVYGSPRIAENDRVQGADGVEVRRLVYEKGDTDLPFDYSGGWLAEIGGWTGKVRISWAAGVDRPYIDRLAEALLSQTVADVWTSECAPATERARELDDPDAARTAAIAASVVLQADSENGFAEAVGGLDGCWISSIQTARGEIALRRVRGAGKDAALVAAPILWTSGGTTFVAVTDGLSGPGATFVAELSQGRSVVLAVLDGTPSDDQFGEILTGWFDGRRAALAEVSRDGGEVTISIAE
jgi:tetratricopeptide (TPR) repeat protein